MLQLVHGAETQLKYFNVRDCPGRERARLIANEVELLSTFLLREFIPSSAGDSSSLSPMVFSRCLEKVAGVTWCPLAGAQLLGKGGRRTQGTVRVRSRSQRGVPPWLPSLPTQMRVG